jgi:hypothetical protein
VLPPIGSLVKTGRFRHILPMLDAMREAEPLPRRAFSPSEFGAIVATFDRPIPRTPTNVLALMLAIGTGRFPCIEFDD